MSTARDELAKLLFQQSVSDGCGENVGQIADKCDLAADAILAAGYRKPRQVSTVAELDALPFESVVRDADGHVLERWVGPDESIWGTVMVPNFVPHGDITLPATILYTPDAPTETGTQA